MNRKALVNFTHDAKSFLEVSNSTYKQWIFRYTFLELEKDLGMRGDITTNSVFKGEKKVSAKILARENGIIAGLEEIEYFLVKADASFRSRLSGRFELKFNFKDGNKVKNGDSVLEIKTELHDLLAVERVLLNLLGRMSGVATFARSVVEKVADFEVLIVPTRKTLWGLLDKKACSVGGTATHRLNLSDAILVKDNHLDLIDRDFDLLLERLAFEKTECRFVEVEVESEKEALKCAKAFKKHEFNTVPVMMFDNFSPSDVAKTVELMKKGGFYDDFLFECSGGITIDTVLDYAKTGIDIISMGQLTDGVKKLDLSLEV